MFTQNSIWGFFTAKTTWLSEYDSKYNKIQTLWSSVSKQLIQQSIHSYVSMPSMNNGMGQSKQNSTLEIRPNLNLTTLFMAHLRNPANSRVSWEPQASKQYGAVKWGESGCSCTLSTGCMMTWKLHNQSTTQVCTHSMVDNIDHVSCKAHITASIVQVLLQLLHCFNQLVHSNAIAEPIQ